jgi:hypothetical protein
MTTLVMTEVMTLAGIDHHKLNIFWQVICLAGGVVPHGSLLYQSGPVLRGKN